MGRVEKFCAGQRSSAANLLSVVLHVYDIHM